MILILKGNSLENFFVWFRYLSMLTGPSGTICDQVMHHSAAAKSTVIPITEFSFLREPDGSITA